MTGSGPAAARSPLVIVPVDRMLAPCLDPVAERLAAAGYAVARPATHFPIGWPELASADVAVLTPRTKFATAEIAAAHRLKGIVFPTIGVEALDLAAPMRPASPSAMARPPRRSRAWRRRTSC
jgi:phosphoglycerate dehydrogenase-like enzyme